MFLSANGEPTYGLLTATNKGAVSWSGTGGVTATMDNNGRISVTLTAIAYDVVTLISGDTLAK